MLARTNLVILLLVIVAMISLFVGARFGLILALGLALGMTLEGLRFGFAGPWRAIILRREPAGFIALLWPRLRDRSTIALAVVSAAVAIALVPVLRPGLPVLSAVLVALVAERLMARGRA